MASSLFLICLKPPNSHRCLQLNHDIDLLKVLLLKYLAFKRLLCKMWTEVYLSGRGLAINILMALILLYC